MNLRICVFGLATSALAIRSDANDYSSSVNGWYPCAFSTENAASADATFAEMAVFECAELEVPLCYDGVCTSDKTIDLFAKRQLGAAATEGSDAQRKAVVVMQGGPGAASPVMEGIMATLQVQLNNTVDLYTFDHRGTGRSEFLMCDAAQALTAGSPSGWQLTLDELQTCFKDLNHQYDGQAAAFSTTSAAMDVRSIIDTFMAEQEVVVAGFSYGTYLAERILQLGVPQVVGYVFDSVVVYTTKHDPVNGAISHWNQAIQSSGRRLLEFCFDDEQCPIQFKTRETVVEETLAFIDQLDEEIGTNLCAQILVVASGYDSPSVGLRTWLSTRAGDSKGRVDALEMLGYVQRCEASDVATMKKIFFGESPADWEPEGLDPLNDINPLLYNVIVYSERWSQPAAIKAERDDFFIGGVFSQDTDLLSLAYCVQTGSTELACQEAVAQLPANRSETFFYKHDKFINAPLELPDHAGALIFSGGLDFSTPQQMGELLYEKLNGSGHGVMLVNFDYGTHCGGEAVAESPDTPCYNSILRDFIMSSGHVEKIDTNCMADLPATVFHTEE